MRIFLIALIISAQAFAETCSQYEFRGSVRIEKTDMLVLVADKTRSEKKLPVHISVQSKLAPYINHYVQLKAIVDKDQIVSIEEVKDDTPDPLNRNADTEMKKVKEIKCPSL